MTTEIKNELHNKTIYATKFGEYEEIPISELGIDPMYQREPMDKHISIMANGFDHSAFGTLIVHKREHSNDPTYYVIDGQQRMYAAERVYGNNYPVPCVVIKFDSTLVHDDQTEIIAEATVFSKINEGRKNLATLEKFFARLIAQKYVKEGISLGVWNISNESGFTIPRVATKSKGSSRNNEITAIETIESIYIKQKQGELYRETLEYIGKHWSKMAFNTRSATLYGISNFLFAYSDTPFLTTERMDKTMTNYSPAEIGELSAEKYGATGRRGGQKGAGLSFANAFYDCYIKSIRKTDEREEATENFGRHWLEMTAKELRNNKEK